MPNKQIRLIESVHVSESDKIPTIKTTEIVFRNGISFRIFTSIGHDLDEHMVGSTSVSIFIHDEESLDTLFEVELDACLPLRALRDGGISFAALYQSENDLVRSMEVAFNIFLSKDASLEIKREEDDSIGVKQVMVIFTLSIVSDGIDKFVSYGKVPMNELSSLLLPHHQVV